MGRGATIKKSVGRQIYNYLLIYIVPITIAIILNHSAFTSKSTDIVAGSDIVFQLIHDGIRTSLSGWIDNISGGYYHFPTLQGFLVRALYIGVKNLNHIYLLLIIIYTIVGTTGLTKLLLSLGIRNEISLATATIFFVSNPIALFLYYTKTLVFILGYALIPWIILLLHKVLTSFYPTRYIVALALVGLIYTTLTPLMVSIIAPFILLYIPLTILANIVKIKNKTQRYFYIRGVAINLSLLIVLFLVGITPYYMFLKDNSAWFLASGFKRPVTEFKLYASHNLVDALALIVKPPGQVIPIYPYIDEIPLALLLAIGITLIAYTLIRFNTTYKTIITIIIIIATTYLMLLMGPYSPYPFNTIFTYIHEKIKILNATHIPVRYGFVLAILDSIIIARSFETTLSLLPRRNAKKLIYILLILVIIVEILPALSFAQRDLLYRSVLSIDVPREIKENLGKNTVLIIPSSPWVIPNNQTSYTFYKNHIIQRKPFPQNTLLLWSILNGLNPTDGGPLGNFIRYLIKYDKVDLLPYLLYYMHIKYIIIDKRLTGTLCKLNGANMVNKFRNNNNFKEIYSNNKISIFYNILFNKYDTYKQTYKGLILCANLQYCLSYIKMNWTNLKQYIIITPFDLAIIIQNPYIKDYLNSIINSISYIIIHDNNDLIDIIYPLIILNDKNIKNNIIDLKKNILNNGNIILYYRSYSRTFNCLPVMTFSEVSARLRGSKDIILSLEKTPIKKNNNYILMIRSIPLAKTSLKILLNNETITEMKLQPLRTTWIQTSIKRKGVLTIRIHGDIIVDLAMLVPQNTYNAIMEKVHRLISTLIKGSNTTRTKENVTQSISIVYKNYNPLWQIKVSGLTYSPIPALYFSIQMYISKNLPLDNNYVKPTYEGEKFTVSFYIYLLILFIFLIAIKIFSSIV